MSMRAWWFVGPVVAAAVSAAGCGSPGPAPILTPTLPPPAGGDPGSGSGGGAGSGSSESVELVTPTPPPAKRGLSDAVIRALDGRPMMVSALGGLQLFAAEQAQAQDIIAAWAATEGLTVVSPRRTSEIYARAALGQDVATGKACGVALSSFEIPRRWKAALGATGKIDAGVYCDPACMLQVSLSIGLEGEGGSEFFAAPFDPGQPWQAELTRRLRDVSDNGGHDRYGHLNNPVPVAGITPAHDWALASAGHSATPNAVELAEATRCLDGAHGSEVQVEYSATGTLTRCEAIPGNTAAAAACVCRALAGHTGPAGAREQLQVSVHAPGETRSKDGLQVVASASPAMVPDSTSGYYKPMTTDPAIEDWQAPDRELLSVCFHDVASGPELTARATVEFDRAGKATKATVVPGTGTLTPAARACLQAAFLRVRAPCPTTAAPSATAEIHVRFEPDAARSPRSP